MNMKITSSKGRFELTGPTAAPMRAIWDVISDTNRINQVIYDLPPIELVDVNSERILAKTKIGGVDLEFEEQPWVWEAPRAYKNVRTFSSGPVQRLETSCEIGEGTFHYAVALTTKSGPIGFAAEKLFGARIERGLEALGKLLDHVDGPQRVAWKNPAHDAIVAKAKPFGCDPMLVEHIASAPDDEVSRIRPYVLAELWNRPRPEVLALCLDAVGNGLLEMRWDALCLSCKRALSSVQRLSDVPASVKCPACDIEFDVARESHVEAVFSPVLQVRSAKGVTFCLGNPSGTAHWLAQIILDPNVPHPLSLTLGAGVYFVQSPGIKERTLIDVGETGDDTVRVTLEGTRGGRPATLPRATPTLKAGRVKIVLLNEDDRPRRVQIMNDTTADLSATAAHVTATSAWAKISATAA